MSISFNPNRYTCPNNQSYLGLHGNSFDRQFQMHNSNYSIVHNNQNHVILSSQLNSNYHSDANVGLGQTNRFISQLNSTTTSQSRSLFGLGQRVITNYEDISLLPQRVQVDQSSVNVDYFHKYQSQYSLSSLSSSLGFLGDQVCVTEVMRTQEIVRTQLLISASTREHLLDHNNQYDYGSWNFQNQVMNHPRVNQTQSFDCSNNNYSQNPNYYGQYNQYSHAHTSNPSFYNQNPPNRNVSHNHATQSPTQNVDEQYYPYNSNIGETILNPQPLNVRFPDGTSIYPIVNRDRDDSITDIFEDDDDDDYDGRTHSLPYKKYGPYTCPRCNGVFTTSQMFAAHVGSHYKDETAEQRRRRRLVRQGKKSMRALIKSNDGLTVVPPAFKRQSSVIGHRKYNSVVANHVDDVIRNKVDHDDHDEESGVGKEIVAIHAEGNLFDVVSIN